MRAGGHDRAGRSLRHDGLVIDLADNLRGADLVLADGRLVRVDAQLPSRRR
ncbi:hypothetical protein GCM10023322_31770 [Rugosimonospora acidiphila]|uniref:Uncharacterized protein n=1 Tax=Rugosimonospora acidiphila TaxID=556531 RepID=A0ABP9RSA6_9ACTN